MNIVVLMGRLTRDAETRYTQNGTASTSFALAVNERYKDQKGEWVDRANFFDVTMWGKRGEAFARFHHKGDPALIHGRLRFEQWQDKQTGNNRSRVLVVAEEWEFAGTKSDRSNGGGERTSEPAAAADDDSTPF